MWRSCSCGDDTTRPRCQHATESVQWGGRRHKNTQWWVALYLVTMVWKQREIFTVHLKLKCFMHWKLLFCFVIWRQTTFQLISLFREGLSYIILLHLPTLYIYCIKLFIATLSNNDPCIFFQGEKTVNFHHTAKAHPTFLHKLSKVVSHQRPLSVISSFIHRLVSSVEQNYVYD